MKLGLATAFLVLSALLGGCASAPQLPVSLSKDAIASKTAKVGVAMTALPKVDTEFPGAGCLLCLAAASVANQSLTAHVQTLQPEDLAALKGDVAQLLRKRGVDVTVIGEPLDLKSLPSFSSKEPNFARLDFSSLKAKYHVDKLVVIQITALGAWRNYASYIPTGDPKAVLKGTGYMVNLSNNALEWYLPVDVQKSADQKWDEPPKFPGLTNAYYQAIEIGKESFTKPFEQ
ncbi:MAG TPA: hypothetical protein VJ743_11560 [Albitalea sp.]|nr:hypothetical protein [Albitalea sp.]